MIEALKRWGTIALLIFFVNPAFAESSDELGNSPLFLDWANNAPIDSTLSQICAEAAEYLAHARHEIQNDFTRLYACIDKRVEQQNTGVCAPAMQNLQRSLTLLDDANAQFVSVCS